MSRWWAFRFIVRMVWVTRCPVWMAVAELDGWRDGDDWRDYTPTDAVNTSISYWEP